MKRIVSIFVFFTIAAGCGSPERKDRDFFTSGSREADQRADQRMAKEQQLKQSGGKNAQDPNVKKALYDRLGGEKAIGDIVDDFVARALADPRVNFARKGVTRGGVMGVGVKSAEWKSTDDSVKQLKKHLAQFLALATGGPTQYDGRDMRSVHKGLHITNAEFDASIGDMKATLDKLQIAIDQQKELLSILESTRPEIVEER